MVLAGSSCLWSEVVGLRAGSNASGRPHPWLRERERATAASARGFHCATFSQKKSCQTHDLSTLLETAYVCVCMSKRHREQRKEKVSHRAERKREKGNISPLQTGMYWISQRNGGKKSLEGKPTPHAPWRFLNPSPQATSGPPSPLSLHLYLLISLSHKSVPSILSGTLPFLGFICSSVMSFSPLQFNSMQFKWNGFEKKCWN